MHARALTRCGDGGLQCRDCVESRAHDAVLALRRAVLQRLCGEFAPIAESMVRVVLPWGDASAATTPDELLQRTQLGHLSAAGLMRDREWSSALVQGEAARHAAQQRATLDASLFMVD